MKTQSIRKVTRRVIIANLLAAGIFLSANANLPHIHTGAFGPAKAEVKYTGVDRENQLSFKVKYDNPTASTFSLAVINDEGETLFKGYYDDAKFSKTFKLPKSEAQKLVFVIEDPKNSVKEKYTVNITTSVLEEITVNKN